MRFSDLKQRVQTAAVLIVSILLLEYAFQTAPHLQWTFGLAALLIVGLCAAEYINLCDIPSGSSWVPSWQKVAYWVVIWGPALGVYIFNSFALGVGSCALLVASFVVITAGRRSLEYAQSVTVEMFFGALLVGFGGASLMHLALLGTHSFLFWVVIVIALNDTGAYFIGKYFGKTKLSPYISPGKSVEGAVGGWALGIIFGCLIGLLLIPTAENDSFFARVPMLFFAAAFIGVWGQVFDLAKSLMKRIAGVKDSGTLLPGHGGFLDRLDGVLGGTFALAVFHAIAGIF